MRTSVSALGRFMSGSACILLRSVVIMKAILLAGGQGTRLRPLTLNTPKPVVPIFDRPFLTYQIDLITAGARDRRGGSQPQLSARGASRPCSATARRWGHASATWSSPSRSARPAASSSRAAGIDGPIVVFNGDVLTSIDLGAVIRLHRERQARATIVLTPVENPSAFGLVETDGRQNILRFLEKPKPERDHDQPDQRRHLRARARRRSTAFPTACRGRSSASTSRR